MRDSWQGQTPQPSSSAAYTSLRSPPPRFRCPLPLLFLSSPPLPGQKNQRVCAHRNLWNKRARWIEEVERVGFIYAGRQVGKISRQPVLPFCASACGLKMGTGSPNRSSPDRVLLAWPDAAEDRRKRPSSSITHKLRHYV